MHKIVSAKIQKTLQTIDIVRLKNLNKHKNCRFLKKVDSVWYVN